MGPYSHDISIVTPAKAGVQGYCTSPALDPRFRGGDNLYGGTANQL
jgi:hypothetical protein